MSISTDDGSPLRDTADYEVESADELSMTKLSEMMVGALAHAYLIRVGDILLYNVGGFSPIPMWEVYDADAGSYADPVEVLNPLAFETASGFRERLGRFTKTD